MSASRSAAPAVWSDFADSPASAGEAHRVRIELGGARLSRQDVAKLAPGAVVSLRQGVEEPVNIYVDGRLAARGEVLVMEQRYCVRLTEIF